MTDQPGQGPEQRLPARREPAEVTPAERFTAPPQAHSVGLTPERAAKIVRQSGSSRWVAFLAVTLVAIFVIGYYFYELGVPGIKDSSRLDEGGRRPAGDRRRSAAPSSTRPTARAATAPPARAGSGRSSTTRPSS